MYKNINYINMSSETSEPQCIICDSPRIKRPKAERIRKIKNEKIFLCNKPRIEFNLDKISLSEIEKDFIEFKFKNEEKKVQNELLNLLQKAKTNKVNKNYLTRKTPQRPLYKYYENCELVI